MSTWTYGDVGYTLTIIDWIPAILVIVVNGMVTLKLNNLADTKGYSPGVSCTNLPPLSGITLYIILLWLSPSIFKTRELFNVATYSCYASI